MIGANEAFYLRACWGPREASLRECARRCSSFLSALAKLTPHFAKWYEFDSSKKSAVGASETALADVLKRGVAVTDVGREVIQEGGFGLRLWNRRQDETRTSISIRCGVYSPWVPNLCLVRPEHLGLTNSFPSVHIVVQVVKAMVQIWDPDDVVVTSLLTDERVPRTWDGPDVGWITYLSDRHGPIPELRKVARTERVDELGTLMMLTDAIFSCNSSEDVGRLRETHACLKLQSRPKLRKYNPVE